MHAIILAEDLIARVKMMINRWCKGMNDCESVYSLGKIIMVERVLRSLIVHSILTRQALF